MRILLPFLHLEKFDRYIPQMKAMSERLDEFHIIFAGGEVVEEWKGKFSFHKVNIPYSLVRSITLRWWLSKGSLYEQIRDIDVDLYYTLSDFWSQEVARYVALKSSKPYVVRLRGNHRASREARRVSYYKKKIINYFEVRSLKEADLVIPISSRLAKFAQDCGVKEDKVTEAVPIGVDAEHFKPMVVEREDRFTVGYAGRISLEKGILRLIEVARKLPNIRFLIAGKKEVEINFPANIRYEGKFPFGEMPHFYNKCDLIILPSFTEGFPCVILEAYACGKPILATFESVPEELQVFGAIGAVSSFPEMIKKIQTRSLQSIGRKAREYVTKSLTWERFGGSMIKCLEEIK
ncbi:MAG: glycosyltransferase [Candidatus Bathyarchaeota archaeon]|nr:MAG: glycosyltransferase [Candidatus Bathyarchaeota archaeon]